MGAATEPDNHNPSLSEDRFLRNLLTAIKTDELRLHYQPRYHCESGEARLFETLVRWQRPGVGLLYPEMFLPLAEKNDLMFNISLWVFNQACDDLIWMRKHIHPHCRLSINLSLQECESLYHAQKLYEICTDKGLELADFEFEITENNCPRDPRKIKTFCDTLSRLGASLSLDDFGARYSPLNHIYTLPVSAIKIDKSFVKNICEDYTLHILVSNLINLAKDLNITTVAEGVEDAQQAATLIDMGCDELQGYYICKPASLRLLQNITVANIHHTPRFTH